jgi:hypothetical protein
MRRPGFHAQAGPPFINPPSLAFTASGLKRRTEGGGGGTYHVEGRDGMDAGDHS